MIDFDKIAIEADRASAFRKLYRDVHKLSFYMRKHKETGDDRWRHKASRLDRRFHEEYPGPTLPNGMVYGDKYSWPIKCLAADFAGVDPLRY